MKLKELLSSIESNTHVRIFAGCMTICNGKQSDVSAKEWNLKIHPYMEANVINSCTSNGIVKIMI